MNKKKRPFFSFSPDQKKYLVLIPVIGMIAFWLISLVSVFIVSFYTNDIMALYDTNFTTENYVRFFTDPFFLEVAKNTLFLAGTVTIGSLIISYPVGYWLAKTRNNRLRTLVIAIIMTPFFVSLMVRLYGWYAFLGRDGMINDTLISLNIIAHPLKLLYNWPAVQVGMIESGSAIMIFSIYAVVSGIDDSYLEAATVLGASRFRTFLKVTLPLSRPGIISGTLLSFGGNMGAWLHPLFLGGGYTYTLGSLIYTRMFYTLNWPLGSAISFIVMFVTVIVVIYYSKLIKSQVGEY